MVETVKVFCINNSKTMQVATGSLLADVYYESGLQLEHGPICARVNNKVEGMHYRVYNAKEVEFLDITSPSGSRAYTRTLFLVLCKAAHDLFPDCKVSIDIPVSNGYYVDLQIGRPVTLDDVGLIRRHMQEMIDADMPIHRYETTTAEAIEMFRQLKSLTKVKLLEGLGKLYTTYYDLDGYKDYYYGSMLTSTGKLYLFGLEKYFDGLLLRLPSRQHPNELGEMTHQDKMFGIFKEHHRWQDIIGLRTVGDLNNAITKGFSPLLIQVSEALQEKKIAKIADDIAARKGVRMVLIAGPSSSGKTTTCKRLSVQLLTNGIKPIGISLDDYFVNREQTPRDEKGDYDYEHLHSLNLPLLNEQLSALFRGEEVQLLPSGAKTAVSIRLPLC